MNRWKSVAISLATAIGLFAAGSGGMPAQAAPGALIRTIAVSPAPACDGIGLGPTLSVGVAFDGTELIVSCSNSNAAQNEILTRVDPSTGANLGTYKVSGMVSGEGIGAISWDADANQLWVGTANPAITPVRIYRVLLNKALGIGTATFAFSPVDGSNNPVGSGRIDDGLSYDGTTKTVWFSPDVFDTIYHYTSSGGFIASHSGLTAALGGFGNSGIAVASATALYLSNDGGSQIYATDKSFSSFTLFASNSPIRLEGLACDNTDFAPLGALWSKDTYDWNLRAYEVPTGQCAPGGDPAITATGKPFSGTEGVSAAQIVATFTDPDPAAAAAEYAATIAWGDASSSAGVISGLGGGPFTVTGSHAYKQEGSYTAKTTITDVDNVGNFASVTSAATVGDAALAASCAVAVAPMSFSGPTANLTDANPFGTASDFTATIAWGDATTSAGTVTGPMGGPFVVSGSHTYSSTGPFTITTTITDDGGSTASTSCSVVVFTTPAAGNFVIGDGNAAVGTSVTYWGAQWPKVNTLSGGSAPASFKGFEDNPSTAACGVSWSTDPGNSTPPPTGPLPAFMAVIVSSSISKSGSTISGNIVHIVIVKTNPGYAGNPGHAGTGTVVAVVC